MLSQAGLKFRKTHSRDGRPEGWRKIPDSKLFELLDGMSEQSSTMHLKTQQPIRVLQKSKRLAASDIGISKSRLCERLRHTKLGYAAANVARGKCDACYCWRRAGRRKVVGILEEMRKILCALQPDYFAVWDDQVVEEDLVCEALPAADSPLFLKKLKEFLIDGETRGAANRPTDPDQLMMMVAAESAAAGEIDTVLADVENMHWHLALKRTIDSLWQSSWTAPQARIAYVFWDHMAPR